MLWLRRPPLLRWLSAGLIVVFAFWIELRPDPVVMHAFAASDIAPGEVITELNTDQHAVPAGLFEPIEPGAVASRPIASGEPVLSSDVAGPSRLVPPSWWVLSVELPRIARVGDPVLVVLLDTGAAIPGVVALAGSDDPFETGAGAVAVEPAVAAEVARSAAEGRVTVLVRPG